jgi:hypothetical protein
LYAGPSALTALSFIGRERELQELAALLDGGRLVTVTGPGGIGKSRLVKQAVRELAARYADGVTWVALDDLADVAQVLPRMAAELALAPDPDEARSPASRHFATPGPARARQRRAPPRWRRSSIACCCGAAAADRRPALALGSAGEWLLPLGGLALRRRRRRSGR